jgi:hypothetical protein
MALRPAAAPALRELSLAYTEVEASHVCCLMADTGALGDGAPACFRIAAALDTLPLGWPGRLHGKGYGLGRQLVAEARVRPRLRRLSLAGAKRLGCHVAGGLPAWLPDLEHLDVANMPLLAQAPPDDLRCCLCAPAPAPTRVPQVAARRDAGVQSGRTAERVACKVRRGALRAAACEACAHRSAAAGACAPRQPARCLRAVLSADSCPRRRLQWLGCVSIGPPAAGPGRSWTWLTCGSLCSARPARQPRCLCAWQGSRRCGRPGRRPSLARAAAGGVCQPVLCSRRRGWLCQREGQPCPALRTLRVPPGFLCAAVGAPPDRSAVRPGLEVEEVAPPPTFPGWVPPRRARR